MSIRKQQRVQHTEEQAPTDEELVIAFQEGDIRGFNELVQRYRERVYWIARRTVIDHDDADDITQEVFVKVHSALKNFRKESTFFTWIYRITVNITLNFLRTKKTKQLLRLDTEESETQEIRDENDTPDIHLERKELKTTIERAIQTLPPKQRLVFTLRHYEELTYEEIAEQLHLSVGGMKANYFHALQKIKHFLRNAL